MNGNSTTTERSKRSGRHGGFYGVLAVCIAVVGGMAVLAITDVTGTPSESKTAVTTTTTQKIAAAGQATSVKDQRVTDAVKTTTTTTTAAETTTTEADTRCLLPLSNAVLNEYNEQPIYWDTLDSWRVHLGVDFAGNEGDTVKAAASGTVAEVFHDALWGDCITVQHSDNRLSAYCGVTATCAVGDTVKAGEAIGALSTIPCEENLGAHLHFEWVVNGTEVNPLTVLQGEIKKVGGESADE